MTFRADLLSAFASSKLRNISMLASGNIFATILPILAAPVLGRLYSPADYGALAQFMAFSSILAVLSTLQLQQAIIAEKNSLGPVRVVWLCLYSSFAIGILTVPVLAFAWMLGLSATAAGLWFWLLPLSVWFSGAVSAGSFLANRRGEFARLAMLPLIQVVVTLVVSISLGFLDWGRAGLLISYFTGQCFSTTLYVSYLRQRGLFKARPMPAVAFGYLRRHWRYPAFTLPSSFFAQLNLQLPIFALTVVGATATLGSFSRARQLVGMPVTVLGGAVSQVFRRDGAELYRKTGDCRPLMLRTALALLVAGIVPVALLIWFAPWLFILYLGPQWGEAGELAQILAPMFLLRLIASPLTTVFQFTEHQKDDLRLMIMATVILVLVMGAAWASFSTTKALITGYSLAFSIVYILYFARSIAVGRR